MDTKAIVTEFKAIAAEQQWEGFHTPLNLSQALMVEVGELLEVLTTDGADRIQIGSEIADVQMYLLALAESMEIDIDEAVRQKQIYNRSRFNLSENSSYE